MGCYGCYGLGAGLHDAVALAAAFGPDMVLGFGAGQAKSSDVLAPAGLALARDEVAAAAALGQSRYFFSFGNDGEAAIEPVAGAIEHLAALSGVGCMAVCLAAPDQGRTVYQGHLFEAGHLKLDLARAFALALDGGVGVVARACVAAGPQAIRAACGRLKEQGKTLILIDSINFDDCDSVTKSLAAMPLAGGAAGFAGQGGAMRVDEATGRVAILSGARDRQTVFQIGVARGSLPVFDLDFAGPDPVEAACAWADGLGDAGAFIITSSVPPDKLTSAAPASAMLGEIARGLAAAGVRRFVLAGDETAGAVRRALGVTTLRTGAMTGPLLWLTNEKISISIKPSRGGAKNLFLTDFGPHLSLNNIAEMAT